MSADTNQTSTRQRVDFDYHISDERLLAYRQIPILDRLKMLDDIRLFTLLARAAPTVKTSDENAATSAAPPSSPTNPSNSPSD